jgi:CRISPR/Cas system CSM-associated protein Csm4 (group 5 of RAMP superfamily)
MKPIRLFEEFINESQKQEAALQKVEALPKGSIFDDAKRIDSIFKINNRSWSEVVQAWEENEKSAKSKTINPKDVQITQRNIQLSKVEEMIRRKGPLKTINVIEFPEGMVIYDGHHRLLTAWALEETKLRVNYVKV